MVYFVKQEQFVGMLSLTFDSGSFFDDFAEGWEQDTFTSLFGQDLWDQFVADPDNPNFDILKMECESLFKYFFYIDYIIYNQSSQSTVGEMEQNAEHAERQKQIRNWKAVRLFNKGVALYPMSYSTLVSSGLYPDIGDQAALDKQNVWAI